MPGCQPSRRSLGLLKLLLWAAVIGGGSLYLGSVNSRRLAEEAGDPVAKGVADGPATETLVAAAVTASVRRGDATASPAHVATGESADGQAAVGLPARAEPAVAGQGGGTSTPPTAIASSPPVSTQNQGAERVPVESAEGGAARHPAPNDAVVSSASDRDVGEGGVPDRDRALSNVSPAEAEAFARAVLSGPAEEEVPVEEPRASPPAPAEEPRAARAVSPAVAARLQGPPTPAEMRARIITDYRAMRRRAAGPRGWGRSQGPPWVWYPGYPAPVPVPYPPPWR